jgi:broad specificity phosphatase PhoE
MPAGCPAHIRSPGVTLVWLVRHGLTTAVPGIAVGSTNPSLSDQGAEQALRLADELAERPLARVWSSDLERAVATAEVIAARHRLVVETAPELREIDFGAWEGRVLGDLWREDPTAANTWEGDFRATPSSFGESVIDLERRVERFWRWIEPSVAGREIAVVGHRGSLAALRSAITGVSVAEAFAASISQGEAVMVVANA